MLISTHIVLQDRKLFIEKFNKKVKVFVRLKHAKDMKDWRLRMLESIKFQKSKEKTFKTSRADKWKQQNNETCAMGKESFLKWLNENEWTKDYWIHFWKIKFIIGERLWQKVILGAKGQPKANFWI